MVKPVVHGTLTGAFFAGLTMFKNLPRQASLHAPHALINLIKCRCQSADAAVNAQVFGRLQSKLFPLYFMLSIACLVLQLGTLAFGPGSGLAQQQLVTLGVWQCAGFISHTIDNAHHTC